MIRPPHHILAVLLVLGWAPPAAPAPPETNEETPTTLVPPYTWLELSVGGTYRGESSLSFERETLLDTQLSFGGWYRSPDRYSVGFHYSHLGLGRGQSGADPYASAKYDARSLWLSGRVYPDLLAAVDLYGSLGLGLATLNVVASGTRRESFTQPGVPYLCDAHGSPDLALRAALGISAPLGERLMFTAEGGAWLLRGTTDVIDGCALGLGSPIVAGVQLGFGYRFEL